MGVLSSVMLILLQTQAFKGCVDGFIRNYFHWLKKGSRGAY